MSHDIHVFVDAPPPLHDFVQELQALLEVPFEQRSPRLRIGGSDTWYDGRPPGMFVDVCEHSHENDDDMPFEEYRFMISLRGRIDYWVERERRLYEYARLVFDKLKEQGKYRIMMTDDIDGDVEKFTPSAAPPSGGAPTG